MVGKRCRRAVPLAGVFLEKLAAPLGDQRHDFLAELAGLADEALVSGAIAKVFQPGEQDSPLASAAVRPARSEDPWLAGTACRAPKVQ